MKFNIKIVITTLCFGILFNSYGQKNVEFIKANFPDKKRELKAAVKNIKKGDKIYKIGKGLYNEAIELYLKANSFNPNNASLNYKIGTCYLNTIQKNKAVTYFETAQKLDSTVAADVNYLLAQAYQLNMQFDNAITKYNEFRTSLSPAMLEVYNSDIDKRIKECETGKFLIANPIRTFIDNIGENINSSYTEHSPIVNADETTLIFTSRRNNVTGGKKDPSDNNYYEDIYISHKINDVWGPSRNPGKPLNTNLHDATVGLSPDGQSLFIYRGDNGGDIFVCKLEGDTWTKPERLSNQINTKYQETSASFSYDNRKIYFVSNKPGGYGEKDIYVSEKTEAGEWGPAINLGPVINTSYDEEGVFMHPDGKTLYFSSKGHSTMGGYDIFKSVFDNNKWSKPENLGYPINTTDDDVFFSISASGKHGYYASGKAGGYGSLDIYVATILGQAKPIIINTEDNLIASTAEPIREIVIQERVVPQSSHLTLLKGTLIDNETNMPIKAQIELYDVDEGNVIANFESNSKTGKYLISLPSGKNYGVTIKADGYLFHSENFNIPPDASYVEVNKDIKLQAVEVGASIILKNIFYDYDKYDLRPQSKVELENIYSIMNAYPNMVIEIAGHTDSHGSDEYNQTLSENRAQAVVSYLTNKGISRTRLVAKGFGKSRHIATNETDEGRQLNRRTEFKILSK